MERGGGQWGGQEKHPQSELDIEDSLTSLQISSVQFHQVLTVHPTPSPAVRSCRAGLGIAGTPGSPKSDCRPLCKTPEAWRVDAYQC